MDCAPFVCCAQTELGEAQHLGAREAPLHTRGLRPPFLCAFVLYALVFLLEQTRHHPLVYLAVNY